MKNWKKQTLTLTLSASMLFGTVATAGCSSKKGVLNGTALAEALLSQERINHEHLSQSFDFLDNRLEESAAAPTAKALQARTKLAMPVAVGEKSGTSKGTIISGSGDTAVYAWSDFERLVTELSYFQSHFSEGQRRTEQVDGNITFLEEHTDIKNKWVKGVSYIDYLMQVEENREIIYANDRENDNYSVGIRTVNSEVNTTYEYYENQGEHYIRTLATPNRRYEYTTISNGEVMAFVAENDNGYWRLTQISSYKGNFSLNVLVMTDDLAYCFRYAISDSSIYPYSICLLSPDLQYEIASLNGSELTIYPGSYTGINELRVSKAEQIALGEYGTWIGYTDDYGYYSTYAAPHIHTDKGILKAPVPCKAESGVGGSTVPTPLDENVNYVNGSVEGLWEQVYPKLVFDVKGETVGERFDNLHAALAKYGIKPIYNPQTVGKMAADVLKLVDGYNEHYTWNGKLLSTHANAAAANEAEKAKLEKYETLFSEAKKLPTISKSELLEIGQNAGFAALNFETNATVSVTNGKITLNGLNASMAKNSVLEKNKGYVLKLALKKKTEELEELVVLDNLAQTQTTTYADGNLSLSLNGEFNLPSDVAAGEYDVVAYAATADSGIRVSKFQRVLCDGQVSDKATLGSMLVYTSITSEKVLRSQYEKVFDVSITLDGGTYTYQQVMDVMENAVMDRGYFLSEATIEAFDNSTLASTPVTESTLSAGLYRLAYLPQADGGKVQAYIYCEIK